MSFHPARPRTTPRTLKETQEGQGSIPPPTLHGSPHPHQRSPQVLAKLGARSEAGLTLLLSAAPFAHKAGRQGTEASRTSIWLPTMLLWPLDHTTWRDPADNPGRTSPHPPPQYELTEHWALLRSILELTQAKVRGGDHSPQQASAQPR